MSVIVRIDLSTLGNWAQNQERAMRMSAQRAGVDALRAMRAEASRRIRQSKNMKPSAIGKRITTGKAKGKDRLAWTVRASGENVPIASFGGLRQIGKGRRRIRKRKDGSRRGGVMVEINRGVPKLIPGAFIATMRSGHKGVFRRERRKLRLPIKELFTTTVADAFKDAIPFIAARGEEVFVQAFKRNMALKEQGAQEARGVWLPDNWTPPSEDE